MTPHGDHATSQRSRWVTSVLAVATVATGGWVVAATGLLHLVAFALTEAAMASGVAVPVWASPLVACLGAVIVAGPAAAMWFVTARFAPRSAALVTANRAWTVLGAAGGGLGVVRAVPVGFHEIYLLLFVVVALAGTAVIRVAWPTTDGRWRLGPAGPAQAIGWAVAVGGVLSLPWLWAGSLGAPVETVLGVIAAVSVGLLAATTLDQRFFAAFSRSRAVLVAGAGLVATVAMVPLAAGIGAAASNLAQLIVLPVTGFAAAAIAALARPATIGWVPMTALITGASVGPLTFVDPEETTTLLGTADVGWWALVASGLSLAAGIVMAVGLSVYVATRRHGSAPQAAGVVATIAAVVVVLTGAGVYAGLGRPGFHGERLLVVLSDQADLSGLATIPDRAARVRATHQRLVEHAERTQERLRDELRRARMRFTPYYLVNAVLVDTDPALRWWLASRPGVDRVLLDQRLRPLPASATAERGTATAPDGIGWNITMVRADLAWNQPNASGAGIVIGTSDSGVDGAHPALRSGFRAGDDSWYDPWNNTIVPTDHNGHGTHTIGTALGRNGIGVAPAAQWIGCVNLDRNLGSPSRYLDCLQFMLAPFPHGGDPRWDGRPERAAHVLTNSWGCPPIEGCDVEALRPATAALSAAGIFVVAAAGNTGPACSTVDDPPAPYADVLTVGAVDHEGVVAPFSSRGPAPDGGDKPDLAAPGVDVLSSLPGGGYGVNSGTSMAAPHVAGVVALMWSANPRLVGDIETTRRILRASARTPLAPADPTQCGPVANLTGAGIVDAEAAVTAAMAVTGK